MRRIISKVGQSIFVMGVSTGLGALLYRFPFLSIVLFSLVGLEIAWRVWTGEFNLSGENPKSQDVSPA